jgi:hypothetical protein
MDNWGLLPKSQIDSTTIDAEIDAKIAAHEADPTAHMGVGESIDMHRKNDVIDHPANSVVADKYAPYLSGSLLFHEDGRGAPGWITVKTGADNEVTPVMFGTFLHGENSTGTRADVAIPFAGYNTTYATEEAYLEFFAMFSSSEGLDSWISLGYGDIYTMGNGAGFRYKASNGHLYAFHKVGATFYDTDLGAPPADEFHKYKVVLKDGNFNFYVDDSFVALHNSNMPTGSASSLLTFGVVPHTGSSGSIYIRYFEYYQSSAMTNEP